MIEYCGAAIRALDMEGRMTVCNMSIEAGARAGLIAPDETTFDYLEGKEHVPDGDAFRDLVADWRRLPTDDEAEFDRSLSFDAGTLEPMITWGTNPAMSCGVSEAIPEPESAEERAALDYMGIEAGRPLLGRPADVVFIGSCTNARISDLRAARPGAPRSSHQPRDPGAGRPRFRQGAAPGGGGGLDEVFRSAGAEWRAPGCSMCIAMNGDRLSPYELAVSTSNRNFEGRQGPGGRTVLASPVTAAASALAGAVADPRPFLTR